MQYFVKTKSSATSATEKNTKQLQRRKRQNKDTNIHALAIVVLGCSEYSQVRAHGQHAPQKPKISPLSTKSQKSPDSKHHIEQEFETEQEDCYVDFLRIVSSMNVDPHFGQFEHLQFAGLTRPHLMQTYCVSSELVSGDKVKKPASIT
jgi:hypothetical protein